jgi:hypothetical protein
MIRAVLALGLLIALCASAEAATVHRSRLPHAHPVQHVTVPERVAMPEHYTVPGWTDQETRKWMTFPEVSE